MAGTVENWRVHALSLPLPLKRNISIFVSERGVGPSLIAVGNNERHKVNIFPSNKKGGYFPKGM